MPRRPPPRRQSPERIFREVGQRIRARRLAAGLTQEEAAHRADIGYKRWQEIETGRHGPALRSLVRIANALGVTIWELMGPA